MTYPSAPFSHSVRHLLALGCLLAASACASQSAPPVQEPATETPAPTHEEPAANGGGLRCGTRGGVQCNDSEFCNFEPDKDCGGTDRGGQCEAKPNMCTKEYRPVCGCDHKTYATACTAHSEGVSVLHDGACTDKDCEAIGGRSVAGIGPAPECAKNEISHTSIVPSGGGMAIEGMLCCVPAQ